MREFQFTLHRPAILAPDSDILCPIDGARRGQRIYSAVGTEENRVSAIAYCRSNDLAGGIANRDAR